ATTSGGPKRNGVTVPTLVVLVSLMVVLLAAITIPLAVIVYGTSGSVTDTITTQLITDIITQTSEGIVVYFTSYSDLMNVAGDNPAYADVLQYNYGNLAVPMANVTSPIMFALQQSNDFTGLFCFAQPAATMNVQTGFGVIRQPCSSIPGLQSPGAGNCLVRIFVDSTTAGSAHGVLLNPVNGSDAGSAIALGYNFTVPSWADFLQGNVQPHFMSKFGMFRTWALNYVFQFSNTPANKSS
ncbi:hypothetical protein HK101_004596, partial [Irineochytrium annulatum]